jgi:hypothetical protein
VQAPLQAAKLRSAARRSSPGYRSAYCFERTRPGCTSSYCGQARPASAGIISQALAFAFFCIALSLAIFFIWTYPANQATDHWATIRANWEQLRWQFVAFCSVTLNERG